jgi:ATPase subunit of ABC transporter with duplicated ATPase domains
VALRAFNTPSKSDNAKKEAKMKELKHFVSRFSANASKSKQATSRLKQLDKIVLDDMRPSSTGLFKLCHPVQHAHIFFKISAMVLRIIANINIFTPLYFAFVSFKFANQWREG